MFGKSSLKRRILLLYSQDGHYYVAIGAALESEKNDFISIDRLIRLVTDMS
jgi:hypothetical protein